MKIVDMMQFSVDGRIPAVNIHRSLDVYLLFYLLPPVYHKSPAIFIRFN